VNEIELRNTDPEDLEAAISELEQMFNIQFADKELSYIATFGQLCDHIITKIPFTEIDECTGQQAFYKLRKAISQTILNTSEITRKTKLAELIPNEGRRMVVKNIERQLDFRIYILRPPSWIITTLTLSLLASVVMLFIDWQTGFLGIVFSLIGFWLTNSHGRILKFETVDQVVVNMVNNNYLKSRRKPDTANKKELIEVLTNFFSNELGLEKSKLSRDASFV
jgi:hypothetical protein